MIRGGTAEIRKTKRLYPALRERIKNAGYTQADIGELLEQTPPTISMKLCGKREWRQEEIEILSVELGLTFEEIGRMFFYKRGQDQWAETPMRKETQNERHV